MSDLRGSTRSAGAALVAVVLATAGCGGGEEPQPSDSVTPPTDAQILADDGRFDDGPLTAEQIDQVCDDIAGTLQDRLALDDKPTAEFKDSSCVLGSFEIAGSSGKRSAVVEMAALSDKVLAKSAELLRGKDSAAFECVIGMDDSPGFSRYVMRLDSGDICTTIPDFDEGSAITSDFTLRSTGVRVTAKSGNGGFDEAIQVRDVIVDAAREAMNNA